jgi:Tfp pilus assembly protein PilE
MKKFSQLFNPTYIITTIGLLVLAVIIAPAFKNVPGPARQNVGKTFAGSMNRAQEAYFKENNRLATFKEIMTYIGFEKK